MAKVFAAKKIAPGSKFIQLLGAAETNQLIEPEKAIQFLEDMTPSERRQAMMAGDEVVIPPGLTNLGNTCYMNSVVQNFKRVDELKDALKRYNANGNLQQNEIMTQAGKGLMVDMDTKGDAFAPHHFVNQLRTQFPLFAQRAEGKGGEQGGY